MANFIILDQHGNEYIVDQRDTETFIYPITVMVMLDNSKYFETR